MAINAPSLSNGGVFQAIDASGVVPGALLYSYQAGTLTPQDTFTTQSGTTPNANPVVCNAAGQAQVWLSTNPYRLILKSPLGVTIWDVDNIIGSTGFIQGGAGATRRITQEKLRERISLYDFGALGDGTNATTTTTACQNAFNYQNTTTIGSFTIDTPEGKFAITGTAAQILSIQNGTKFVGGSLEGTSLLVASGSTATSAIQDAGNAAKVEINNLTISGNSNASLTSGLRLGHTIQFGTYGTLDNIMVRDAPNAIAFDLKTNIAAVGKLYSKNTKDGLISHAAGSGLHIESFTPLGFSGIGMQLAAGDSCNFYEAEAPTLDSAVPIVF